MRQVRQRYASAQTIHALGRSGESWYSAHAPESGSVWAGILDAPFPEGPAPLTEDFEVWYARPNRLRIEGPAWMLVVDGETVWSCGMSFGRPSAQASAASALAASLLEVFFYYSLAPWVGGGEVAPVGPGGLPARIPRREFGVFVEEPPVRDKAGLWVRYESHSPRNPILCEWLLEPDALTVKQARARHPVWLPTEVRADGRVVPGTPMGCVTVNCSALTWQSIEFDVPPPRHAFRFEGRMTLGIPPEAVRRVPPLAPPPHVPPTEGPEAAHRDEGLEAPDLVATDLDGNQVNLGDYRGHYALVAFCESGTPQGAQQLVELQALRQWVPGEHLGIIAVALDGPDTDVRGLTSNWGLTFPLVHEPERSEELAQEWGVLEPPNIYLVSPQGWLVAIWPGPKDATELLRILHQAGWWRKE